MSPRRTSATRKDQIVKAALTIIGQKGVHSLTTAGIARVAGMSEANLYRHFQDKDEILLSVGSHIGTVIMGTAAAIAGGKGTPVEKLERIYASHITAISEAPGIPRYVFSEVHICNPRLSKAMADRMRNYMEILAGIVSDGIVAGSLRENLSPRETAVTLLGMIQFTALRHSLDHGSFDLREDAVKLWNNFRAVISRDAWVPSGKSQNRRRQTRLPARERT
jgi:AcrR family transcriptional regulator